MTVPATRDIAQARLLRLIATLFIAYLCVGLALPVVPVFVSEQLGLSNAFAGLGVGAAFLATIATRGYAGSLSDRCGAKPAVARGLGFYIAGAVVTLLAGVVGHAAWTAFLLLLVGRILLGWGESLVAVGIISWGIDLAGPARSGRVLALVGAAMYGALAVGGPIGLALLDQFGFVGVMGISAALPAFGLLAIWRMNGMAAHKGAERPSFLSVVKKIRAHGAIICLQGFGFAAIGAFFALHFRSQHWSHAGLGLTAFGAGFVLVRLLCGHLPDRIGGLPVAMGSLLIEALGQILIWAANDPTLALAGAFLTGLGCSMVFPSMGREVVQLVAPHLRGTAMGAFSAFQDLAYGLTGPLTGALADRAGYGSVYLIGGCAALLGFLIALRLGRGAGKV